ncbi:MAG: hypothetical protein QXE96_06705 [Candidatus Caldarchaeum sp.]
MVIESLGAWLSIGSMFLSTAILGLLAVRGGSSRNAVLFSLLSLFTLTHGLWHLALYLGQRWIAVYLNPISALLLLVFTLIYFRRYTFFGG